MIVDYGVRSIPTEFLTNPDGEILDELNAQELVSGMLLEIVNQFGSTARELDLYD